MRPSREARHILYHRVLRINIVVKRFNPQTEEQRTKKVFIIAFYVSAIAMLSICFYALHVSAGTVKSHVGSIFTKLGVRDRAGAIVYAYQHGIASPPGPS